MSDLAAAIRRATARLKRASLSRKYDPNQPRVPAGNPDGGQWTDGGGGPSSPRPSPRRTALGGGEASGSAGWTLRAHEKIEGGERTLHAGPGGALIASERRIGAFTGSRASSHSVRMPDGSGLRIDPDRTGVQRIFDERGNLLAATRWGRNGPEDVAAARLAFFDDRPPRLPKGALWLDLGLTIYDALKDQVENSRPVKSLSPNRLVLKFAGLPGAMTA